MGVESSSSASAPAADELARFLDLVSRARGLQAGGEPEAALDLARSAEALAAGLDPAPSPDAAKGLNALGIVFFEAAFNRSALALYERALAMAERLEPRDDDLLASLHNNLGQASHRLGQLTLARSRLETAVAMRERSDPDGKVLGFVLDNLATVIATLGELDRAEEMHRRALAIFKRQGGPIDADVATAFGNLSMLHRKRRDFMRAEACRLRALDTHERLGGLANSGTVLDIAGLVDIYRESGDETRADTFMNLLLTIGGETPGRSHRFTADMLRTLASNAFGDFRLDLAERLATRAVALLEAIEGPQAPETLSMLHLLGNVHRAGGHREAAEQAYHRARSGYEALGKRDQTVAVMGDLGKLYRDAGAFPLARQLFGAAVDHLRRAADPDHQAIAGILGNLALVHFEAEQYVEADAVLAAALDEAKQDRNPRGERPWLLHNQAMLKYHFGAYDTASELYAEAKRLWTEEHGEDHPFVATAAANLALVHWARGDADHALAAFAEAEALRDREMQRVLVVGSEAKRSAYARDLQSDLHKVVSFCITTGPPRADVARFAAQMLLRRKGRVLDAIAHTLIQVRESVRPADRAYVARLQEVRREIASLIAPVLVTRRPSTAKERIAELRREEERLEAELSHRGALHQPGLESVTLDEVRQGLPPGGALIEFLRYPSFDPVRTGRKEAWKEERYAALVLRPSGEPRWFDLGPSAAIDSRLDAWRRLLRNRARDVAQCKAAGSVLHGLLVAPLADAIDEVRHLFVAPDGKLALIPFGLLGDAAGPTLDDRCVVSYLASGRDLLGTDEEPAAASAVVVIAAPDFEAEASHDLVPAAERLAERHGFAPLAGTEGEAEDLVRLFRDATLFKGPEATVSALRSVHRPLVLHVATHGIFAPLDDEEVTRRFDVMPVGDGVMIVQGASKARLANPMFFSGLALAGANRQGAGILTAQEIAGLDLRGTVLAVLSACETGLGTVKQGEEFTGLRRALAIAGAATQVTSLWKVDDTATRVLMGHYYRLLLEGCPRAMALQVAQAQIANDPEHPEWRHPVYWAAFVSAGAWGAIDDRLRRQGVEFGDTA